MRPFGDPGRRYLDAAVPTNGAFTVSSFARMNDCVTELRRSGRFRIKFNNPGSDTGFLSVEGKANFAGAIREVDRMFSRTIERAKSGACRLRPPIGPED